MDQLWGGVYADDNNFIFRKIAILLEERVGVGGGGGEERGLRVEMMGVGHSLSWGENKDQYTLQFHPSSGFPLKVGMAMLSQAHRMCHLLIYISHFLKSEITKKNKNKSTPSSIYFAWIMIPNQNVSDFTPVAKYIYIYICMYV